MNGQTHLCRFLWTESHRRELRTQLTYKMIEFLESVSSHVLLGSRSSSVKEEEARGRSTAVDVNGKHASLFEREVSALKVRFESNKLELRVHGKIIQQIALALYFSVRLGVYLRPFREAADFEISDTLGLVLKLLSLLLGTVEAKQDDRNEYFSSLEVAICRHFHSSWIGSSQEIQKDVTTIPRALMVLSVREWEKAGQLSNSLAQCLRCLRIVFDKANEEEAEEIREIAAKETIIEGGAAFLAQVCGNGCVVVELLNCMQIARKGIDLSQQCCAEDALAILSSALHASTSCIIENFYDVCI